MFDSIVNGRTALMLVILLCVLAGTARSQDRRDWEDRTAVQALVGATCFSALSLDVPHSEDGTVAAEADYTWMPLVGISGQYPLMQASAFGAGLEGTALAGWRSESATAHGANGTISVHFENSLFLVDLSLGPCISVGLGRAARVYAAAGPLLMIGVCDSETREVRSAGSAVDDDHDRSSAFGAGFYGRTGIELRLAEDAFMGVGVRAFSSRLDFDNVEGDTGVKGVQFMITYTVGL